MVDKALSQAIKEAYASAPADSVVLHTMELYHPSFQDGDGNPKHIRVVQNHSDITAVLEPSARNLVPVNPSNPLGRSADISDRTVVFKAFPFVMSQPTINKGSVPEALLEIDNVTREIVDNIERAVESDEVIQATYRAYLSNDLLTPQYDPALRLTMVNITATTTKISGRLRFRDLANKRFPAEDYTPARFPRLVD